MNGELNAENVDVELTTDERIVLEPSYLSYLREHGHTIESINEAHTVKRKKSDKAHLVVNITTIDKSKDDPELDYVRDEVDMWVCDCGHFTYRKGADVSKGEPPSSSGACTHIKRISKVRKAQNDENQATLGQ